MLRSVPYIGYTGFCLSLVGSGNDDYVADLREIIREEEIQDRVLIVPGVPPEKVPAFLALADVFVLASIYDAFPSAIVEAFAARKPVVATRVGGVPEIVEDGVNGYLVPRMDPKALAEKIDALLADGEKRMAFGEEGRRRVAERFTLEKMVSGAETVFHKVCRRTEGEFRAKWAAI